jgi:hypothetical protein
MSEPPPDRLMSPDGRTGWFAYSPNGARDSSETEKAWEPPPDGSLIRFMGDYGATVPLWGDGGLMFGSADDVVRSLGVSQELAAELEAWGSSWDGRADTRELDAEAAALVRRFQRETGYRFQVLYHP